MRRNLVAYAVLIAVVSTLALAVPALAAVTPSDVEEARQRVRDISSSLEEEAARYEAAYQVELGLREDLERLVEELADWEVELTSARFAARDRVLEMYMKGSEATNLVGVFDSPSFEDLPARLGYLDAVADADQSVVNHLAAVRENYLDRKGRLEVSLDAQAEVQGELAALGDAIGAELAAADAEYRQIADQWERQEEERRRREEEERRRREEEERRRQEEERRRLEAATSTTAAATSGGDDGGGQGETTTTTAGDTTATTAPPETTTTTAPPPPPPPPNPAGRVCPVNGPHAFSDTWGAPRSGGRSHEGVDMMASRGTPLVAIESGVIGRLGVGNLSGNHIWLYGDSGDHFFYAHLDRHASGLSAGQRVGAGQNVGTVGSTGNASYSYPHLHFEYHPGGNRGEPDPAGEFALQVAAGGPQEVSPAAGVVPPAP